MARAPSLLQRIVHRRRLAQVAFAVGVYLAVARFGVELWWIIGFGAIGGVLLGKFFCRWMCPLGAIMETVMGSANQDGMYPYFKVGCPIAWVSGLLNRVSLTRVQRTGPSCAACGKCDEACYITKFHPEYSVYKPGAVNPSTVYACSRCLDCVAACPTQTLSLAPPWRDARGTVRGHDE